MIPKALALPGFETFDAKEVLKKLRELWNDKEFSLCLIPNTPNDTKWQKTTREQQLQVIASALSRIDGVQYEVILTTRESTSPNQLQINYEDPLSIKTTPEHY